MALHDVDFSVFSPENDNTDLCVIPFDITFEVIETVDEETRHTYFRGHSQFLSAASPVFCSEISGKRMDLTAWHLHI